AMFEADELPPDLVAISAVRWRAEEAEHHVRTQEFEKFSLLDGAHQLHLLLGRERRDTGRVGKDAGARSMKKMTPASRAPGVSSDGRIVAASASISAASAGVSVLYVVADCASCHADAISVHAAKPSEPSSQCLRVASMWECKR